MGFAVPCLRIGKLCGDREHMHLGSAEAILVVTGGMLIRRWAAAQAHISERPYECGFC